MSLYERFENLVVQYDSLNLEYDDLNRLLRKIIIDVSVEKEICSKDYIDFKKNILYFKVKK